MNVIYFVLAGLLLYVTLRLTPRVADMLFKRFQFKKEVDAFMPFAALILWVAYVFWGSFVLFGDMKYYELLLLVMAVLLVFGIAWFYFRDYFAGLMIRSDYKLRQGQYIVTPQAEGLIVRLGSRFAELENDKGEQIKIAYSQLVKHWINVPADLGKGLSYHLVVPLPDDADIYLLREALRSELIGMPWITGTTPALQFKKDKNQRMTIDLRYELLKEEHNLIVESRIRHLISSLQVGGVSPFL